MEESRSYSLWSLAIPIAFEAFFQMLFGFTDTYVLSRYSDLAVAAAGYVNQFLSIILLIFRVAASGTSILLAQSIGAQNKERQTSICTAAFWLSIWLGVLSFLLVFFFRNPVIRLLILNQALHEPGKDYLEIMSLGLFFQSVFAVFTSLFRSYGKAVCTSAIAVFANLFNVIGDLLVVSGYLHIFGTIKDVALVTVIANLLSALLTFILFIHSENLFADTKKSILNTNKAMISAGKTTLFGSPNKTTCREILTLGIPAAGESCSYKCSQMVVTMIIGLLGTEALTAKIYAMNFSYLLVLLPNAIATAAGIMVGVHLGAGELNKAKTTAFSCIRKGTAAIAILDVFFLFTARQWLKLFTHDPLILSLAYVVLMMDMVTMFVKNGNLTLGNSLRAAGDVRYPVVISIFSMWGIGTALAWFFAIPLNFGLPGIFAAFFLDEVVRVFLLWRRWKSYHPFH